METKTQTEQKVDQLKGILDATEVKELERLNYRLSDAIREGASVTDKETGTWGNGETACAMHAAVIAAHARGYMG